MIKTNAARLLDAAGIHYELIAYEYSEDDLSAGKVAASLGEDIDRVFKTLVTATDKGEHCVFCVPVCSSLDLKRAAKAAGAKSVAMIKQRELEPLTGYVHGGCSPVGMKKRFRTFIDESALSFPEIYVSAGRVGVQMRLSPQALAAFVGARFAPLASREEK